MKHMVANTSRSCLLRFRASCSILITFLPFLSSSPSRNRINNNGVSRMMWENVTHLALHLALHLPLLLHFLPLGVLSVADSRAAQTVSSEVFSTAPVPFPPSGGSVFPSPTSSGWSRVPSLGDPAPPSLHSPYLQLTPINLDPSTQPLKDINIVQHRIGMDAGNVMFNATELDRITNLYREVFSAYTFLVTVHSQQLTKTSDIPVTLMSTEHDQLTVSEVASSSPVTSSVSYSDEIAVPRLLQSGGYVISVVINIYPFQEVSVYALGFAVSDLQTVIMERYFVVEVGVRVWVCVCVGVSSFVYQHMSRIVAVIFIFTFHFHSFLPQVSFSHRIPDQCLFSGYQLVQNARSLHRQAA